MKVKEGLVKVKGIAKRHKKATAACIATLVAGGYTLYKKGMTKGAVKVVYVFEDFFKDLKEHDPETYEKVNIHADIYSSKDENKAKEEES